MHEKIVTEGLVLGKRGVGEANAVIAILTKELGLLRASARSSRVERSKLRYGLELLSQGRFSFVRGKYGWHLVGVDDIDRRLAQPTLALPTRMALGRITKLLLRLLAGEEHTPRLYDTLARGFVCMTSAHRSDDIHALETVLVLRVLSHLGYVPQSPELARFLEDDHLTLDLAPVAAASRPLLIKTINESLGATGL